MPRTGWRFVFTHDEAKVCGWIALEEIDSGPHTGWFAPVVMYDQVIGARPGEPIPKHTWHHLPVLGLWRDPVALYEYVLGCEGWSLAPEDYIDADD